MNPYYNIEVILLGDSDYDLREKQQVKEWVATVLLPYIVMQDRWVSKLTVNSLSYTPPIYLS